MPFTSNHAIMEHFCTKLSGLDKATPVQCVLRDVLRQICHQSRIFDQCVSKDSPFFHEFFDALRLGRTSDDCCFSILECLVIFCREKNLYFQGQALSLEERSLLNHFEGSGIWEAPGGQTLVGQWYWEVLPRRHAVHGAEERPGHEV